MEKDLGDIVPKQSHFRCVCVPSPSPSPPASPAPAPPLFHEKTVSEMHHSMTWARVILRVTRCRHVQVLVLGFLNPGTWCTYSSITVPLYSRVKGKPPKFVFE